MNESATAVSTGTGSDPKQTAQDALSQTQDKAQELKGQAHQQASQAKQQASQKVNQQIDQRTTQASEKTEQIVSDLRSTAQTLREQGQTGPANLIEPAAEQIERLGSYLQRADGQQVLQDFQRFGRQRPWAVALGGLSIGIALSRVLRASQPESQQWNGSGQSYQGASTRVPRVGADYSSPSSGLDYTRPSTPTLASSDAASAPSSTPSTPSSLGGAA